MIFLLTKAEMHQCADFIQSNVNKIIDIDNLDDLEFLLNEICRFLEWLCNSKQEEITIKQSLRKCIK